MQGTGDSKAAEDFDSRQESLELGLVAKIFSQASFAKKNSFETFCFIAAWNFSQKS